MSFPWQDYNRKRQIKFGANLGKISLSLVTWGLFCLLIGLHLVCRLVIGVAASTLQVFLGEISVKYSEES